MVQVRGGSNSVDFTSSFVQLRGSIPLMWSQIPNIRYKPNTRVAPLEDSERAFDAHIKDLLSTYQVQISLLIQQASAMGIMTLASLPCCPFSWDGPSGSTGHTQDAGSTGLPVDSQAVHMVPLHEFESSSNRTAELQDQAQCRQWWQSIWLISMDQRVCWAPHSFARIPALPGAPVAFGWSHLIFTKYVAPSTTRGMLLSCLIALQCLASAACSVCFVHSEQSHSRARHWQTLPACSRLCLEPLPVGI